MKKTKFYILTLTLLLSLNCSSQTKEPNNIIDTFFDTYTSKGSAEAIDYIFTTNEYISKDDIVSLKSRIKQYENILGKFYNYELFTKKKVGESIEVHSYIMKYERQPIRFIITFYKPNNNWKIYGFKISDDFVSEIESATIELSYKEKN